MTSSNKQLVDIIKLNTICSACNECETIKCTSFEEKANNNIIRATKTSSNEGPLCDTQFFLKPSIQKVYTNPQNIPIQKATLKAHVRDVSLKHNETVTPTTSSTLDCHSAFAMQEILPHEAQSKCPLNSMPIQGLEMISMELNIPTINSVSAQLHSPNTTSSLLATTLLEAPSKVDVIAVPTNMKCKMEKFPAISLNANLNRMASTSKQKSKKKICMCQDARTMVFVRSNTQVAYNGPHFAHPQLPLPQNVTQQNTMTDVLNPSLYNFANTQSNQVCMHQETDKYLMQAQTSAQEAIVAATSALAQSHYNWSQMQNQVLYELLFFYSKNAFKCHIKISINAYLYHDLVDFLLCCTLPYC